MSGYVVKKGDLFVNATHLGTIGYPVFHWCERENDAHQFDKKGAAEAIAFLVDGQAYWYDSRFPNERA